jgi:serine/threonine protein phosphatase 1
MLTLPLNVSGSDYIVGDIHGRLDRLERLLALIQFDPEKDRLISVGDLVDRGPNSVEVLRMFRDTPCFYAIRGNHEDMCFNANHAIHLANGGAWYYDLDEEDGKEIDEILHSLPLAIQIVGDPTSSPRYGFVHAEVPEDGWRYLQRMLEEYDDVSYRYQADKDVATLLWSRRLIGKHKYGADYEGVAGVERVFVGHTPVTAPITIGNVTYIDTGGGYKDGMLTAVKLTMNESDMVFSVS